MSTDLPDSLKQFVDPERPKEMRLMAARGLVPVAPKDLMLVLYTLTRDTDEEVAGEAKQTLVGMPPEVVSSVLSDTGSEQGLLDLFARVLTDEEKLQKILLNNTSSDETVAYLAERVHGQNLIELIANNHERVARSYEIVEALSKNPAITRSTLDGVIDFLKLYMGKKLDMPGLADDSEDAAEKAGDMNAESIIQDIEVPDGSFLDEFELDAELVEEDEGEEAESQAPDTLNQSVFVKISTLNIGQKIKLAILGNREARTILIKDPNRIVSRAVLKNPRLTDSEAVLISQSKIVSDEILREIAESRKWARLYQIKLALVTNPKTPPHISITLLRHLRESDLRNLRWNKNLPGVIATAVKQMMQERRDRK